MSHTFWLHGEEIGSSRFESSARGRKLAGVFEPTNHGRTVLPQLTAIVPALFAFGELCRRLGLDVDDDRAESAETTLDRLADTPEAKAVANAAKCVAALDVRDSNGRALIWQSLVISDLEDLIACGRRLRRETNVLEFDRSEPARVGSPPYAIAPPRYYVSLTLAGNDAQRLSRPSVLRLEQPKTRRPRSGPLRD